MILHTGKVHLHGILLKEEGKQKAKHTTKIQNGKAEKKK